jgi:hypothetical protein
MSTKLTQGEQVMIEVNEWSLEGWYNGIPADPEQRCSYEGQLEITAAHYQNQVQRTVETDTLNGQNRSIVLAHLEQDYNLLLEKIDKLYGEGHK